MSLKWIPYRSRHKTKTINMVNIKIGEYIHGVRGGHVIWTFKRGHEKRLCDVDIKVHVMRGSHMLWILQL